jgi:hypothetical protein
MPITEYQSATSLTTAQQCEQLYYWKYDKLLEESSIGNGLKTGLIMHVGQESYMRGHSLRAAINAMEDDASEHGFDDDPLFNIKNEAYIRGYYNRWEAEDAKRFKNKSLSVLGIEKEFEYIFDGIKFVGKMDALMQDNDTGEIILWEHKNVSSKEASDPTSLYWRLLPMNTQMAIYAQYLIQEYKAPVSVMYDVVVTSPKTKPGQISKGIRRRKDETAKEFAQRKLDNTETLPQFASRLTDLYLNDTEGRFIRQIVPLMNDAVETRMVELSSLSRRLDEMDVPTRNPGRCSSYGGCAFVNACLGLEDPTCSSKFKRRERAHTGPSN